MPGSTSASGWVCSASASTVPAVVVKSPPTPFARGFSPVHDAQIGNNSAKKTGRDQGRAIFILLSGRIYAVEHLTIYSQTPNEAGKYKKRPFPPHRQNRHDRHRLGHGGHDHRRGDRDRISNRNPGKGD